MLGWSLRCNENIDDQCNSCVCNELCIIMIFWQENKRNKSGSLERSSHI